MAISKKNIFSILAIFLILLNCSGCSNVNGFNVTNSNTSHRATSSTSKQVDLSSWIGSYQYTKSSTNTHSGAGHTVLYSAKIYKENGRFYARVIMFGWQAAVKARATLVGNNQSIKFLICKTLPKYMFPYNFKPGTLLFTFNKKNNKLYTTWAGINPTIDQNHKEGQYFEPFHGKDTTDLNW